METEYCKKHPKIKLNVTPFGTWCPICREEAAKKKDSLMME